MSMSRFPSDAFLAILQCPFSGQAVVRDEEGLRSLDGDRRYAVTEEGIALFGVDGVSAEAKVQEEHYDKVAQNYLVNLTYPHTQEYMAYLDRVLLDVVDVKSLGMVAEICCGRGEAFALLGEKVERGVGIDISQSMLRAARHDHSSDALLFVQGDATSLPLVDGAFDSVFMLGGVHHVRNRERLFSEVARILKPGGRFYFREPLSDFFLWKAIRDVIYRLSPSLDHETEQPLRRSETLPYLKRAGLAPEHWTSHGFLGFCLFMNSDVLVFNRLFRFLPGIRSLTREAARFDEWVLRFSALRNAGLQVVGVAVKPAEFRE